MTARASGRRALFTGAAALLAAPALPASASAGENMDADLLAHIAAFHAVDQESRVLLDAVEHLPSIDPRSRAAWEHHYQVLSPRWHDLKWTIATTLARTRNGLAAKAACALEALQPDGFDEAPFGDEALSVSVMHDLLGLPPGRRGEG